MPDAAVQPSKGQAQNNITTKYIDAFKKWRFNEQLGNEFTFAVSSRGIFFGRWGYAGPSKDTSNVLFDKGIGFDLQPTRMDKKQIENGQFIIVLSSSEKEFSLTKSENGGTKKYSSKFLIIHPLSTGNGTAATPYCYACIITPQGEMFAPKYDTIKDAYEAATAAWKIKQAEPPK